jgi:hypothetical protein
VTLPGGSQPASTLKCHNTVAPMAHSPRRTSVHCGRHGRTAWRRASQRRPPPSGMRRPAGPERFRCDGAPGLGRGRCRLSRRSSSWSRSTRHSGGLAGGLVESVAHRAVGEVDLRERGGHDAAGQPGGSFFGAPPHGVGCEPTFLDERRGDRFAAGPRRREAGEALGVRIVAGVREDPRGRGRRLAAQVRGPLRRRRADPPASTVTSVSAANTGASSAASSAARSAGTAARPGAPGAPAGRNRLSNSRSAGMATPDSCLSTRA